MLWAYISICIFYFYLLYYYIHTYISNSKNSFLHQQVTSFIQTFFQFISNSTQAFYKPQKWTPLPLHINIFIFHIFIYFQKWFKMVLNYFFHQINSKNPMILSQPFDLRIYLKIPFASDQYTCTFDWASTQNIPFAKIQEYPSYLHKITLLMT
jgi:hypothetical protein